MTRLIFSMRSRARGMLFLEQRSDTSCEETGGTRPLSEGCSAAWLGQGPYALREGRGIPAQPQPGLPLFPPPQSPCEAPGIGTLTEAGAHAPGDLQEDAHIAAEHDEQRQQEEAGEAQHVVEGLVPGLGEAAARGALGEVVRGPESDRAKEEELWAEQRWDSSPHPQGPQGDGGSMSPQGTEVSSQDHWNWGSDPGMGTCGTESPALRSQAM